jgi:glycosyltransferase involved in cell wall biosynthesis
MSQMIVAQSAALGLSIQHWRTHDVQVCYDGIEVAGADDLGAQRLREALLDSGTVLIGSVGRLECQKGYDLFVEAAKELARVHPEARFAIAGEGPLRAALESRIHQLGLQRKFHLCGFRSDVATFLRAIDIFVCFSRYEGGPYTVAEALMASKPVISTPVGFVPELSCDGQNVDLVPIGDVAALIAAMRRAIVANDARVGVAEARSRVRQFFNPLLAAEKFDSLLRAVSREEQNRKC